MAWERGVRRRLGVIYVEPEGSGASGRLQLKATAWVNMGFCTLGMTGKAGAWALVPKAGLADLEIIQCGWKESSAKLGWNWVSRFG